MKLSTAVHPQTSATVCDNTVDSTKVAFDGRRRHWGREDAERNDRKHPVRYHLAHPEIRNFVCLNEFSCTCAGLYSARYM